MASAPPVNPPAAPAPPQPPANVFAAKKVKLELPAMFGGNPDKLEAWLFAVE